MWKSEISNMCKAPKLVSVASSYLARIYAEFNIAQDLRFNEFIEDCNLELLQEVVKLKTVKTGACPNQTEQLPDL